MKHTAPSPRRCRAAAREALFHSSNWIAALIATYSVMLILFFAVRLIHGLLFVFSLFSPLPDAVGVLLYAASYLLLSPMLVGLLYYYTDLYRAAHGEGASHVPPSVIFSPYSTFPLVIRAWGQISTALLLCAMIPLSVIPLVLAMRKILADTGYLVPMLLVFSAVIALLAALYLNARLTPSLFLSAHKPELSFGGAIRRTWRLTADFVPTAVVLQLTLLIGAVLSLLLSAGIVFFLYVMPISVFTYVACCHEITRRCDLL